jgi:hypothetical protein
MLETYRKISRNREFQICRHYLPLSNCNEPKNQICGSELWICGFTSYEINKNLTVEIVIQNLNAHLPLRSQFRVPNSGSASGFRIPNSMKSILANL